MAREKGKAEFLIAHGGGIAYLRALPPYLLLRTYYLHDCTPYVVLHAWAGGVALTKKVSTASPRFRMRAAIQKSAHWLPALAPLQHPRRPPPLVQTGVRLRSRMPRMGSSAPAAYHLGFDRPQPVSRGVKSQLSVDGRTKKKHFAISPASKIRSVTPYGERTSRSAQYFWINKNHH